MWLLILLLMCGVSRADVFVITAPDKSVFSLSEADDAVLPNGYTKTVIKKKNISDLTVTMGEEKMYDFNGSKFTLNSKKVSDKNKDESDRILKNKNDSDNKKSAIEKLKVLGLTDAELSAILGK